MIFVVRRSIWRDEKGVGVFVFYGTKYMQVRIVGDRWGFILKMPLAEPLIFEVVFFFFFSRVLWVLWKALIYPWYSCFKAVVPRTVYTLAIACHAFFPIALHELQTALISRRGQVLPSSFEFGSSDESLNSSRVGESLQLDINTTYFGDHFCDASEMRCLPQFSDVSFLAQ